MPPVCNTFPIAGGTYQSALFVRIAASSTSGSFADPVRSGLFVPRDNLAQRRKGMFSNAAGYVTVVSGGFEFSMPMTPTGPVTDAQFDVTAITIDTHDADLNDDGKVCYDDYLLLLTMLGQDIDDAAYHPLFDFDLDADIDNDDVTAFKPIFFENQTLPGDADCDCVVDTDDLNAVLSNWGTAGPTGDLDLDGDVDADDLNIYLVNSGTSCP